MESGSTKYVLLCMQRFLNLPNGWPSPSRSCLAETDPDFLLPSSLEPKGPATRKSGRSPGEQDGASISNWAVANNLIRTKRPSTTFVYLPVYSPIPTTRVTRLLHHATSRVYSLPACCTVCAPQVLSLLHDDHRTRTRWLLLGCPARYSVVGRGYY